MSEMKNTPSSPRPDTGEGRDRSLTGADRLIVFACYHSDKLGPALQREIEELASDWQDDLDALSRIRSTPPAGLEGDLERLSREATQGEWCAHLLLEMTPADSDFCDALVNAYRSGHLVVPTPPEGDLIQRAREIAAQVFDADASRNRVAPFVAKGIRAGKHDDHLTVKAALRALSTSKTERDQEGRALRDGLSQVEPAGGLNPSDFDPSRDHFRLDLRTDEEVLAELERYLCVKGTAAVFRKALTIAKATIAEARARDEQPKAENPKGLSPQGASPADEVGAPGSIDQAQSPHPLSHGKGKG